MVGDALEVRISDDPVAINIAREEAKRNVTMRLSVPVDVFCVQHDVLHIGHTREICPHFVTAEGNCSDCGSAADNGHVSGSHRGIKGEDRGVVAYDAIFNSRRSGERHVDVERTGSSLGHTRSRADQVSWGARTGAHAIADKTRDLEGISGAGGLIQICFIYYYHQRLLSRRLHL